MLRAYCWLSPRTRLTGDGWLTLESARWRGWSGGLHAPAWWNRLREEVNSYTDPADAQTVVANMEVLAVAEAMERGAFVRVDELTRGSQFDPVDHAAISAQFIGLIVAHIESDGMCPISEMLARLRRACGLQDGAA